MIGDRWGVRDDEVARHYPCDDAAARQGLDRWYEAGADMPVVTLPPNRSVEELDPILDALAPAPTRSADAVDLAAPVGSR
jgi:hypothetical protein